MAENVTQDQVKQDYSDDKADAFAAIAIISIVVATVVYWLSGMPL